MLAMRTNTCKSKGVRVSNVSESTFDTNSKTDEWFRWAGIGLASWVGKGDPRLISVADMKVCAATSTLEHGWDSGLGQQWRILCNGRKSDTATSHLTYRIMTHKWKEPSNKRASRRGNTYGSSISHHNYGCKGCVGCYYSNYPHVSLKNLL